MKESDSGVIFLAYLPLFPFVLYRPSWESVKGRPKARETPLLLGLIYIVLQGHQFIKKQELSCKVGGWFLFPACGWWLQASCSKLRGLQDRERWAHSFRQWKTRMHKTGIGYFLPLDDKPIAYFMMSWGYVLKKIPRLWGTETYRDEYIQEKKPRLFSKIWHLWPLKRSILPCAPWHLTWTSFLTSLFTSYSKEYLLQKS